jgi:hypothetical protein
MEAAVAISGETDLGFLVGATEWIVEIRVLV